MRLQMTGLLALGLAANTEVSQNTLSSDVSSAFYDPTWLPVALEKRGSWSFCWGTVESEY